MFSLKLEFALDCNCKPLDMLQTAHKHDSCRGTVTLCPPCFSSSEEHIIIIIIIDIIQRPTPVFQAKLKQSERESEAFDAS